MSRSVPRFKSAGDHCYITVYGQFNIWWGGAPWNKISPHAFVKVKYILRLQVGLWTKNK